MSEITLPTELENSSKLVHQYALEEAYHKNQLITRIKQEFLQDPDLFVKEMEEKDLDPNFALNLLVQMALHKRTTLPTIIGILRYHFTTLQECADNVVKALYAGLMDWDGNKNHLVVKYSISDAVQAELDKFQFPLPMVVPPAHLYDNRDTGYLTEPVKRGSLLLKDNHHNGDICLDHLNLVNKTKFTINYDTAHMVKNKWKNLDRIKDGETRFEYNKRVKAFDKYNRSAYDVIDFILKEGNEFYLTHRYDKRGRTYCQGYHINYQGTEWNKACVELADKELVI